MSPGEAMVIALGWIDTPRPRPRICRNVDCLARIGPLLEYEVAAEVVRDGYCRACWGEVAA